MELDPELLKILIAVQAVYPNFRPQDPAKTIEVYINALSVHSTSDVRWAAENLMATCRFFPTVAEFVQEIKRLNRLAANRLPDPLRARAIALEDKFYQGGEFDEGEWINLWREFKRAGREDAAEALNRKCAVIRDEAIAREPALC